MNLGRLQEIKDLRRVWPHEALDFTPWLAEEDNLSQLADAIGLEITVEETESSVGDFSVDISATETGTERKIIIENQLGYTDHWMSLSVGSSAYHINLCQIRRDSRAQVEWYIPDDKILYQMFLANKTAIESEMGVQLEWQELPEKKASRILISKTVVFDNKDTWPEQFDWMMDIATRMKTSFRKFL